MPDTVDLVVFDQLEAAWRTAHAVQRGLWSEFLQQQTHLAHCEGMVAETALRLQAFPHTPPPPGMSEQDWDDLRSQEATARAEQWQRVAQSLRGVPPAELTRIANELAAPSVADFQAELAHREAVRDREQRRLDELQRAQGAASDKAVALRTQLDAARAWLAETGRQAA